MPGPVLDAAEEAAHRGRLPGALGDDDLPGHGRGQIGLLPEPGVEDLEELGGGLAGLALRAVVVQPMFFLTPS